MAACILCGKSAGLFHALHKGCLEKYHQSDREIGELLLSRLGNTDCATLTAGIDRILTGYGFKKAARQRTLVRALEFFPKKYIDKNPAIDVAAWINFLKAQPFDERLLLNKHFVVQQENLPALQSLRRNKLPKVNGRPADFPTQLRAQESLWWCFNHASMLALSPAAPRRQWSVIRQLVDGLLAGKPKPSLPPAPVATGKILLTSQRLHFTAARRAAIIIEYANIYSCTPVADGVRIQIKLPQALPETYLCEDGRLLYQFLHYAREQRRRLC